MDDSFNGLSRVHCMLVGFIFLSRNSQPSTAKLNHMIFHPRLTLIDVIFNVKYCKVSLVINTHVMIFKRSVNKHEAKRSRIMQFATDDFRVCLIVFVVSSFAAFCFAFV